MKLVEKNVRATNAVTSSFTALNLNWRATPYLIVSVMPGLVRLKDTGYALNGNSNYRHIIRGSYSSTGKNSSKCTQSINLEGNPMIRGLVF